MQIDGDIELQELFVGEVKERSSTLAEGARAMEQGEITPDVSGTMLREGHTIKGTGRVMGYDEVSDAGLMCESIWRAVSAGDLEPTADLGRALGLLADVLPDSLEPEGQAALAIAMRRVRDALDDEKLLAELPQPMDPMTADPEPVADEPERAEPAATLDAPNGALDSEAPLVEIDREALKALRSGDLRLDSAGDPDADANLEAAVRAAAGVGAPDQKKSADRPAADAGPVMVFGDSGQVRSVEGVESVEVTSVSDPEPAAEPEPAAAAEDGEESSEPDAPPPEEIEASAGDGSEFFELPSIDAGAAMAETEGGASDLGGLIGALANWASEETIPVNAGRLYTLINHVAAMRIDIEAMQGQVAGIVDAASQSDPIVSDGVEGMARIVGAMHRAAAALEHEALRLASSRLNSVTNTLPQLVRYLGRKTERDVRLEIVGDEVMMDRQVLDRVSDVIRHLVVNAIAHGVEDVGTRAQLDKPETALIALRASAKDQQIEIVIADDGKGVDWEAVRAAAERLGVIEADSNFGEDFLRSLLYTDGFTTLEEVGELAGDGKGLAEVKRGIEDLYGGLTMDTIPGQGTSFTVTVPAYRALQRALIVEAANQTWGIPEAAVADVLPMSEASIVASDEGSRVQWGDGSIPLASFSEVVGIGLGGAPTHLVVISSPVGSVALTVDGVAGSREVAAKELGPLLAGTDTVTGAALLGGGEVVLLVDTSVLAERERDLASKPKGPVPRVLVVDDSMGVQQVVSGALASSGFATYVASSVAEALAMLSDNTVDALVVDFSMPRADGVALVHMVRQRYGEMPVVMLSGVANEEDVLRAKKAGVDAFFDKADFREGGLAVKLKELIEDGGAGE